MIVVGGDALIDMIVTPEGRLNPVVGGGQYNTARTLGRLGAEVSFLGRISDDWFGRMLLRGLRDDGVGTGLVVETADPSTLVLAEIDEAGVAHNHFYLLGTTVPGLEIEQAQRALDEPPEAVHVGTLGLALEPVAEALATLVEAVPDATLIMVDPNCRPAAVAEFAPFQARMRRILAHADIVKLSIEDLDYLQLAGTTDDAVAWILAGRTSVVLLTDGADAVRVFCSNGRFELPVEAVEVVDTIGAGDAFGGGFLARWLELGLGREELGDEVRLRDAVLFAIHVAAITCARAGADPPTRAEVMAQAGATPTGGDHR